MKYFLLSLALIHSWTLAQWSRVPDIPENRVVPSLLMVHDTLYAATDSLFYIGASNGTQWSTRNSPVTAPDIVVCLLKSRGVILAGTLQHGVFKSTNEGASWQHFSDGLSGLGANDISGLQVRRDSLVAATLGAGVFACTSDFTHPWFSWGDSLPEYQGDNVFKMLVVGNTVLAGAGSNGYMFRLTDAQPWWNPIPLNTPRFVGQSVSGMASNGNVVIAGTNKGIYRSTNEGLSWTRTNLTLPPTIQILPLFRGSTLFALATTPFSSLLFASTNAGEVWQQLGEFPLPNALDAAIIGETFFVGLPNGLWEAPVSALVTSVEDRTVKPASFILHQNFPNPFNPATKISFEIPSSAQVTLKVFDLFGREVATLVNEDMTPGNHEAVWDAGGVASGVYFSRIQAGGFVQTRRMLLLK